MLQDLMKQNRNYKKNNYNEMNEIVKKYWDFNAQIQSEDDLKLQECQLFNKLNICINNSKHTSFKRVWQSLK